MNKDRAAEDIAFIRRMIEDSRRVLVDNGLPYIIWGALSMLGTLLTYGAVAVRWSFAIPWIWAGFAVLGTAGTFAALRARRKKRARSAAGLVYGGVWIGMLLLDIVISLCLYLSGVRELGMYFAVVSGGLGLAYFASSAVTRDPFLFMLSFVWWAGSVALVLVPGPYAPPILAGLGLVCELVPGVIIYARTRRLPERPDGAVDG